MLPKKKENRTKTTNHESINGPFTLTTQSPTSDQREQSKMKG
jgi:hypothetical protein